MTVSLGAITLPAGMMLDPADDLWSALVQSTTYTLSGALVVEEAERLAGRPLTLTGGRTNGMTFARMTRAQILALKAALDSSVPQTLTLGDGRTFRVMPRRTDGAALEAYPAPGVGERAPADPGSDWPYVVEKIRLMEVPA
jgi:hypothetical protein